MKYINLILGFLLATATFSTFLKRTELGVCDVVYYYPVNYYVSSIASSYSTVTYPIIDYTPLYYFTYTYTYPQPVAQTVVLLKKNESSEKASLNLFVIHDKDLQNYEVNGKLIEKNKKDGENWFVNGKNTEKAKMAMEACKKVHTDIKNKGFANEKIKKVNNLPDFLIPKKETFKRTPTIVKTTDAKEDNNTVVVTTKEEAKAEEKKPVEKKEAPKVEAKTEEKKPVEKKVAPKIEAKAEEKPLNKMK